MFKLRQLIDELHETLDTWDASKDHDRLNRSNVKPPPKAPQKCPPGEVRNKETGRCVSLRGALRH